MALRSPAEYFNEHGEGVYFALPGAQIMSAGPLDDPYDIIVEPSGLPQILTLQPNGGLRGAHRSAESGMAECLQRCSS